MKKLQFLVIACVTFALSPMAMAAPTEHAFIWNSATGMQDLGTLGGLNSYALGINDSGEVVGYSQLADNITTHGFTWTPTGGMVDLGSLPGGTSTQGSAINASGVVAGNGIDASGKQVPLRWSPGSGFETLPENVGDQRNYAFGINDAGDATGQRYHGDVVLMGFFWVPGRTDARDIGAFAGAIHSVGNAINNLGHITGTADIPSNGNYHGFFWTKADGLRDLGRISHETYIAGEAINGNDEIVGFALPTTNGFYWSRAAGIVLLQTLGGLHSAGFGINNSSAIAGYTDNAASAYHAALWSNYTSAPQDLGTLPGGTNSYARGINSSGQVVGYADVP